MASSFMAFFQKGNNKIQIDGSGAFKLGYDFIPPLTDVAFYTATGTSANVYNGAQQIGEKGQNRDWSGLIHITGSTQAHIKQSVDQLNYLLFQAGDPNEPLYFVWYPDNDVGVEPVWGQSWRRIIVEYTGGIAWGSTYLLSQTREYRILGCPLTLNIRPFAYGKAQILANAMGGIIEDRYGITTGTPRGLYLRADLTTNLCTNPSFETNTTGWNVGANATITRVPDGTAIAGNCVARVVSTNNTTNRAAWIDVNGSGPHYFSVWVKSTAGDSLTLAAYNATDGLFGATNFTMTGNWQRINAAFSPTIAGATSYEVYRTSVKGEFLLDAVQIEVLGGYSTPYHDGDMLGFAWSGTAHASTTIATAAYFTLPFALISPREGSVKVVVKTEYNNTFGNDQYIFDSGGALNFKLWFSAADDKWNFSDGTNTISSAAQTWTSGDVLELVATWKAGALNLYKNGANIASGSTYTPYIGGNLLYFGANESTSSSTTFIGRFDDLKVYDKCLTGTEIEAIYVNDTPLITDGVRIGAMPWLWSLAANGITYQYIDATHIDYGVAGGIDGTVAPVYTCQLALSVGPNNPLLANISVDHYFNQSNCFTDQQGTVVANALNGQCRRTSVNTTPVSLLSAPLTIGPIGELFNKRFWGLVRLADAGSNLVLALNMTIATGGLGNYSAYIHVNSSSTLTLFEIGPLSMPINNGLMNLIYADMTVSASIDIYAYRTVAGAANVDTDFARIVFADIGNLLNAKAVSASSVYFLDGRTGAISPISTIPTGESITTMGNVDIQPNKLNILRINYGDGDTSVTAPLTEYITTDSFYIIPRWSLL